MNKGEDLCWSKRIYVRLCKLCMEIHQRRCKNISIHHLHLKPRDVNHEIQEKKEDKMCRRELKRNFRVGRLIFLTRVVSGEWLSSFLSCKITSVLSLYCGAVSVGLDSHTGLD